MFEPRKILVPTDFSETSDRALRKAVEIARQFKSKVFLLHVIDKAVIQCVADYCLDYAVVKQLEKDSERVSRENLDKEAAKILQDHEVEIEYDVQHGTPAEVILHEQEAREIDLIVIASHGKSGITKVIMGSVAEKVVRGARCEVLLVR